MPQYNKIMSKLVTIKITTDMREAKIVKGLLQSNGIEADIFYDNLGGYMGDTANSIRIKVKEEDKKSAEKLLNKM